MSVTGYFLPPQNFYQGNLGGHISLPFYYSQYLAAVFLGENIYLFLN